MTGRHPDNTATGLMAESIRCALGEGTAVSALYKDELESVRRALDAAGISTAYRTELESVRLASGAAAGISTQYNDQMEGVRRALAGVGGISAVYRDGLESVRRAIGGAGSALYKDEFENVRQAIAGAGGISALYRHELESVRQAVGGLAASRGGMEELVLSLKGAISPAESAMKAFAGQIAGVLTPFETSPGSNWDWELSLSERMGRIETRWAYADALGVSATGFARVARIADATHAPMPFAEPVAELLSEELGDAPEQLDDASPLERDAAAMKAGLNPELIAFPAAEFEQVVLAAGFQFQLVGPPIPTAIEQHDTAAAYDPMHGAVITEVEQRLRQLVEARLAGIEGEAWIKRRVPDTLRKRWTERQQQDRDLGRPVYALIQYADFMDLADLICRADNWKEAFEVTFRNAEDFRVSLRRLHPVRLAIAHGRPLGRADVLTLAAEATRLLGSLGVQLLGGRRS